MRLLGRKLGSSAEIEPDWRVADPSDEEPFSVVHMPDLTEAELAISAARRYRSADPLSAPDSEPDWRVADPSDEEPFSIIEMHEPTDLPHAQA